MAHFINCTSCGKQYNKDAFEECPFCGFSPNGKTVICPNRLCGKEVSDKFDHCPFCHTKLIKPTKTAEDIINEYKHKADNQRKQEEDELRDIIRKRYNIEGDITEEQYKQLIDIYEQENGNRILPQKNDDSPISKRNRWTIPIILSTLVVFLVIIIGISSGNSNNASKKIRTADQWVTYCDSEPNIHRCLKAFDKIGLATQCQIYEDLTLMVAHLTYNDDKGRIKADSYGYLWIYMTAYDKGKLMNEELRKEGVLNAMNNNYAIMILTQERMRELIEQWKNE